MTSQRQKDCFVSPSVIQAQPSYQRTKRFIKEIMDARVHAYIETCRQIRKIPNKVNYEELANELSKLVEGSTNFISRIYNDPLSTVRIQSEEEMLETLTLELRQLVTRALIPLSVYISERKIKERESLEQRLMVKALPLEKEQEDLLSTLVEAYRNVPRESRQPFLVRTFDESYYAEILHKGLPGGKIKMYEGDIKILSRYNLLDVTFYQAGGIESFEINPEGFTYYTRIKQHEGKSFQNVESSLRAYIEADRFRQKYSKAYQKWKDAEAILWETDSERQLTTIGHLCREALQEFAATLVDLHQPPNVQTDKTKTVARLKAVLSQCENQLGSTKRPFLDALLAYWGTVSDLVQRQEHGGHKEGRPLIWEDGRRVVFQTFIVMYEIDSSLSRGAS